MFGVTRLSIGAALMTLGLMGSHSAMAQCGGGQMVTGLDGNPACWGDIGFTPIGVDPNYPSNNDSGGGSSGGGTTTVHTTYVYLPDSWGAIVSNPKTAQIGHSKGYASKEDAVAVAKQNCGNAGCTVIHKLYANQCVALVDGEKPNGGFFGPSSVGNTIGEAESKALNECNKAAHSCRVFYSDCSFAEDLKAKK